MNNNLVEHECLVCGDHEMCDSNRINICSGCENGIMKVYKGDKRC